MPNLSPLMTRVAKASAAAGGGSYVVSFFSADHFVSNLVLCPEKRGLILFILMSAKHAKPHFTAGLIDR